MEDCAEDHEDLQPWQGVGADEWNDWRWQLRNRITDADGLERVINLTADEKRDIGACLGRFRMAVTPYYSMLMDKNDPGCPIRRQAVPSARELESGPGELDDPLDEQRSSPVENLVHRYPDRVLLLLTRGCAMYCRHCTRRRVVGGEDYSISPYSMDRALEYIDERPEIRDVLISGGDPLIMPDDILEGVISRLRAIPHVEIIRIGTRAPVVLPMRITDGLTEMLRKYHPIWINTHFNHPLELTPVSIGACARIADAGIPIGNQSVLLKGINDNAETLKQLFLKLVRSRVRPYYLYQCDPATGISHFRTPVEEGIEIMRNLRGYISGYAIPSFVIDAPGGGGKIPINPDYLVDMDEESVTMRNYKGDIYTYPNIMSRVV